MGNAESRAAQKRDDDIDEWREKRIMELHDQWQKNNPTLKDISILFANATNAYDDSHLKTFKREQESYLGRTYNVYIGGVGYFINKGQRGFAAWHAQGWDHRQDDNVMYLGEKHGEEYAQLLAFDDGKNEFISLKFDIQQGMIKNKKPEAIYSTSQSNDTSIVQEIEFAINEKTVQTSEFVNTSGITFSEAGRVMVGVPTPAGSNAAETEIVQTKTVETQFEFGKKETKEQEYILKVKPKVPAKTKVTCTATVFKGTLNVPYTLKYRRAGEICYDKDEWRGVASWHLDVQYKFDKIK